MMIHPRPRFCLDQLFGRLNSAPDMRSRTGINECSNTHCVLGASCQRPNPPIVRQFAVSIEGIVCKPAIRQRRVRPGEAPSVHQLPTTNMPDFTQIHSRLGNHALQHLKQNHGPRPSLGTHFRVSRAYWLTLRRRRQIRGCSPGSIIGSKMRLGSHSET